MLTISDIKSPVEAIGVFYNENTKPAILAKRIHTKAGYHWEIKKSDVIGKNITKDFENKESLSDSKTFDYFMNVIRKFYEYPKSISIKIYTLDTRGKMVLVFDSRLM